MESNATLRPNEFLLEVGKRIEILELEIKLLCMVKFRRDF